MRFQKTKRFLPLLCSRSVRSDDTKSEIIFTGLPWGRDGSRSHRDESWGPHDGGLSKDPLNQRPSGSSVVRFSLLQNLPPIGHIAFGQFPHHSPVISTSRPPSVTAPPAPAMSCPAGRHFGLGWCADLSPVVDRSGPAVGMTSSAPSSLVAGGVQIVPGQCPLRGRVLDSLIFRALLKSERRSEIYHPAWLRW
jgi:hypothetical protein